MYYSIKIDHSLYTRAELEISSNFWHGLRPIIKKQRMVKDEGTNRSSHDGTRTYHGEIPKELCRLEKEEA